jgi:hypothetical protein
MQYVLPSSYGVLAGKSVIVTCYEVKYGGAGFFSNEEKYTLQIIGDCHLDYIPDIILEHADKMFVSREWTSDKDSLFMFAAWMVDKWRWSTIPIFRADGPHERTIVPLNRQMFIGMMEDAVLFWEEARNNRVPNLKFKPSLR